MQILSSQKLLIFIVAALILLTSACAKTERDFDYSLQVKNGLEVEQLVVNGGRVDWYKGRRHNLIAYDAISNRLKANTEVFTIQPNGSNRSCVTCDAEIPKGFVGQPAWHPDGEHIVIQVENENSKHRLFEHLSFGFNNDLWIVSRDGSRAELIYKSDENHAALHPHFNKDGTKIIFAERMPTNRPRLFLKRLTPGGENHWDGWSIHIADVNLSKSGTDILSNHKVLFEDRDGFFETHGFTNDGKIVFSHTEDGHAFVDDIYISATDGRGFKKLIDSPQTWDEHGSFSPSGNSLAFNSSRGYSDWKAKKSKAKTIRLDLYLRKSSGKIERLTYANENAGENMRYIVSDFDWNETGEQIALQLASYNSKTKRTFPPQIWILKFQSPQ